MSPGALVPDFQLPEKDNIASDGMCKFDLTSAFQFFLGTSSAMFVCLLRLFVLVTFIACMIMLKWFGSKFCDHLARAEWKYQKVKSCKAGEGNVSVIVQWTACKNPFWREKLNKNWQTTKTAKRKFRWQGSSPTVCFRFFWDAADFKYWEKSWPWE